MKNVAKMEPSLLAKLFRNSKEKLNLPPAIVEKDFWVCWMLDYLFNSSYLRNSIVFKGGTSLSKGYGLIERFSEDLDIILDWRLLGYDPYEPWLERSNTRQDLFNKEINTKTEDYLRDVLVPKFNKDIKEELGEGFKFFIEEDNKQVVAFQYRKAFESDYVVPYVRLEIGALARLSDYKQIGIEPYIVSIYKDLFRTTETNVLAIDPIRTFWEKITILHREAFRPIDKKCPERYSRHYYDVYCMAKSKLNVFCSGFDNILNDVVAFKEKFYRCPWARYDLAKIGSLMLMPPAYNINFFREDYEKMKEMIYGEKPSFDEILYSIKELEIKINSMENIKNEIRKDVEEIEGKQDDGYEIGD